jgi:dolichol-phosphate mannosyltransferase
MPLHLAISMPVFNEETGIINFIQEIAESLTTYQLSIIVVDDCSTDNTLKSLEKSLINGSDLALIIDRNEYNIGHGPSTIKGMAKALGINPDIILTIDGDGQFLGHEIAKAVSNFLELDCDMLEGVRISRLDPLFRKITTFSVRVLVWIRSGVLPTDGNTPFRIYKPSKLSEVLKYLPDEFQIPNIFISTFSRNHSWKICEMNLISIPPRGVDPNGSTWKQKFKSIPSKKFVFFCFTSFAQWVIMDISLRKTKD